MLPDGTYVREAGGEGTSSQEALYRYFSVRKVSLEEPGPQEEKTAEEKQDKPDKPGEGGLAGGERVELGRGADDWRCVHGFSAPAISCGRRSAGASRGEGSRLPR